MKWLLAVLAALPLYAAGPDFCASCHEIRPQVDLWRKSTHRGVECTDCHEYNLMRNVTRARLHFFGDVPEMPKLGSQQALAMGERCERCHRQQFAEWKAGPHSATYARLFTNNDHNHKRQLMDDCLRCHGMHQEQGIRDLVKPIDTKGPWKLTRPELAAAPAIPCLACHAIHREGTPVSKPEQRVGAAQHKTRPSLGLFDRRSRLNIPAAMLPVPAVFDGDRAVKISPDERQGLCYQCHAALAQGNVASGDDRTPVGVHEGFSCFACHQGHQQDTRASCAACHPRLSNCGIDVEKMDTTFRDPKSRHNVHRVKCLDCHPSGVPRRTARSAK